MVYTIVRYWGCYTMNSKKRILSLFLAALMCVSLLSACASQTSEIEDEDVALASGVGNSEELNQILDDSAVKGSSSEVMAMSLDSLDTSPAVPSGIMPAASGTKVLGNTKAQFDASNTADGYIMAKYLEKGTARLKVLVKGPSGTTYQYNLNIDGNYETFPLSDGDGKYTIGIYQHTGTGTKYSTLYSTTIDVKLKDQFAPFILPNQYVNYTTESLCVKKAAELAAGKTDTLDIVNALYSYVVKNFTYDTYLAQTVQSGYLPDLDKVFEKKTGICFDYAALLTAMLRSQGIPTKLVVGYAGTVYHAWINVYSEEQGWMDAVIFFDGSTWKLMDPTFASSANSSSSIMKYIGNGNNYAVKYLY